MPVRLQENMRNIITKLVSSFLVRIQLILPGTIFSLIALIFLLLSTLVSVGYASSAEIDLSPIEKQWLKEHPVIRLAPDPNFAPIEWFTLEGQFKGISADYVALIEQKLGIKFEVVHADSWSIVMDMARNRQVDLLAAAATSPQREEFLVFTEPHINVAGVLISAKDFNSIEELIGHKVAVVVDYIWDDLLTYHKTDLRLVRVEDTLTGLELTALGAVDAMVSDLATVTHIIKEEGFTNLAIVSRLDRNLELSFAVRDDWPELHTILNKAVASLTVEEKEAIQPSG